MVGGTLFQAREWWHAQCGAAEEFDGNCLCAANVDNDPDELGESAQHSTAQHQVRDQALAEPAPNPAPAPAPARQQQHAPQQQATQQRASPAPTQPSAAS